MGSFRLAEIECNRGEKAKGFLGRVELATGCSVSVPAVILHGQSGWSGADDQRGCTRK